MKKVSFMIFAMSFLIFGCKKNEEPIQINSVKSSSTSGIRVFDGRLVFENERAIVGFAEKYSNLAPSQLDSLELTLGFMSYRRSMGENFYDEKMTLVESNILGTVLNPQAIYQVGDSAFFVYKSDTTLKVHMLSGVTDEGLSLLESGILADNIQDVTDLDIYGDMSKTENCGNCRTTQQKLHVKKSDFTYQWSGQTRYVKCWTKYEGIGALKTLFSQMKHYRGADILTPLPSSVAGRCKFYMNSCAKYQFKIKKDCYTRSTDIYNFPQSWSGTGASAFQLTAVQTSKCIRNFHMETIFKFEYEESGNPYLEKNFGNRTWSKGFTSCL